MALNLTRRRFTLAAAAAITAARLPARQPNARRSVAEMEHDHILADAAIALNAQPTGLMNVSASVAALTAAFVLTQQESYALAAFAQLADWLPAPISKSATPPSVVDLVPAAEIARSISFLTDAVHTDPINAWLVDLNQWLNTAHGPVIERDTKDHRASAWLLLVAAIARSQRDDATLDACRKRFRHPTLRNQVSEAGQFPQEMATANPFRNTLFNFDLLCGACQLLDSPLDPLWPSELIDGVSLRSTAAWLFPILKDPGKWPGIADAEHFRELPGRRPGLLFTGRAYEQSEYVELWRTTPPAVPTDIAASFPIRQPFLWTTRAPYGY
ncbi:hypothetical protein GOB94_03610 [Granulicella sp. 5B5]|uniref:alginate lyase family protein n=1 Tax=Granulicella sp. 5B5 TaxID=1617967 RepID=UPI0015F650B1|nr:alginate lyase family protein [Granulicella sp. 5B5]QMV17880.1 hypothetical protein GOB94_03610 [Granulicella sp. 5B5]